MSLKTMKIHDSHLNYSCSILITNQEQQKSTCWLSDDERKLHLAFSHAQDEDEIYLWCDCTSTFCTACSNNGTTRPMSTVV